jgi:multidrug resistance efflux pump
MTERIRSEVDLQAAAHATLLAMITLEKAQLERTRINLEWEETKARLAQRTVRSPIDGIVARCLYQEGDTIDRLAPVIEIVDLDLLWIEFHAPVEHAELFQSGSVFQVRRAAQPAEVRQAVVRHASLVADPSSQTFLTRLQMPNDRDPWRAGVKVIIELPTAAPGGAGRKGQRKK